MAKIDDITLNFDVEKADALIGRLETIKNLLSEILKVENEIFREQSVDVAEVIRQMKEMSLTSSS